MTPTYDMDGVSVHPGEDKFHEYSCVYLYCADILWIETHLGDCDLVRNMQRFGDISAIH